MENPTDLPPPLPPQTRVLEQPPGCKFHKIVLCPLDISNGSSHRLNQGPQCCILSECSERECNGQLVQTSLTGMNMTVWTCSAHRSDETLYDCLAEDGKTVVKMKYLDYIIMMQSLVVKLLSERIALGPFVTILRSSLPEEIQTILHRDSTTDNICVSFIDTSKPPTFSLELRRINGRYTMCLYIKCVRPGGDACNVRVTNAIDTLNFVSQVKGGFGPFQLHPMPGQPIDLTKIGCYDIPSLLYILNSSDSQMILEMFSSTLLTHGYTIICDFMILLKSDIRSLIELVMSLSLRTMHNNWIIRDLVCPFLTFLSSITTDAVNCQPPLKGSRRPAFFGKLIEMGLMCAVARKHRIDAEWVPFMMWLLQMILAKLSVSAELEFLEIRECIFDLIKIQKDPKIVHDFPPMPGQVAALFKSEFQEDYNRFKASVQDKFQGHKTATAVSISLARAGGGGGCAVVECVASAASAASAAPAAPVESTLQTDKNICIICLENPANYVLIPCGHLRFCKDCSDKLEKCPECRVPIKMRVRTYPN
jgi:hypothetical protein